MKATELRGGEEHLLLGTARLRIEWGCALLPDAVREPALWIARQRAQILRAASPVRSIWRTPGENKRLRSKSETHVRFGAVDIGGLALDPIGRPSGEEEMIRAEANRIFPTGLAEMPRVAPLSHGTGPHYHVQATIAECELWLVRLSKPT